MTSDDVPVPSLPLDDPALSAFIIERELGGGGMSRLFVATDRQFDRRVVIKVLVPTDVRSISIDRFRREISVATSLQHPNIVPIFSAGEIGGEHAIPFLVMPYVEGESLRDRLLRGPMSVREAVAIARDVARALVYAHDRGIVHRDIKPGNVLLSSGAAVVSDFGVAKALTNSRQASRNSKDPPQSRRAAHHSLTAIGISLGTPAYMAPEQAAADPNVDHRADLYALGIVLYEMLVGTTPFHGRSPQELLRAQLSDPPPPLSSRRYDIPVRLVELVDKCLEKEPARRPRNATEVFRWLDDPAVVSGAFAMPTRGNRRRRNSAMVRVASAVMIVAALAASAFYFGKISKAVPDDSAVDSLPKVKWSRQLIIGPIRAIGNDARAKSFVESLSSEIANEAANVPGVRIGAQTTTAGASRDTVRDTILSAIKDSTVDTGVIRLEGSVQRENLDIRVLLRAVDVRTDSALWSGSFDGRTDSLLVLQSRVARNVAGGLTQISLTRNVR